MNIEIELECPSCGEIDNYDLEVDEDGYGDDVILCNNCDCNICIEEEEIEAALKNANPTPDSP